MAGRGQVATGPAGQPGGWRLAQSNRWTLAIVAGCLAAPLFPTLPNPVLLGLAAVVGLAVCAVRLTRPFGIAVLALCWTLVQYAERSGDRLAGRHARAVVTLTGTVTSVPAR